MRLALILTGLLFLPTVALSQTTYYVPDDFGSIQDARVWARSFFRWYNHDHHHTALGLMTPAVVHYGQAEAVTLQRRQVLRAAYAPHPERFVHGEPQPPPLPKEVFTS